MLTQDHSSAFIYKGYSQRPFPGGSDSKASTQNAGDPSSIPGLGRSPGEGDGNPLQCSCLENSMGGGAWWATVHGVTKSQTQLREFTSLWPRRGELGSPFDGNAKEFVDIF